MSHPMLEEHQALLDDAIEAVRTRACWSAFPENPNSCDEATLEEGRLAFEAYQGAQFYLDQPGVVGREGAEVSPYGLRLDVSYPVSTVDALISAARSAIPAWTRSGPAARVGISLEIISRLHGRRVEIAHALMHTTGQSFALAYQAVIQSLNRGLEALVHAAREMHFVPEKSEWVPPAGGGLAKRFTIVPRGIALAITDAADTTWNAYPGLFASLATGNPVIVKPHPEAILPLAITVAVARQALKDAGADPNLISLLVDSVDASASMVAALNPEIRIIDYAGGTAFGAWLQENARQAIVFAVNCAVNCTVIDSTDDYRGLLRNLAFGLSLNSGQSPAAPKALFVSREGVKTPEGVVDAAQFGRDIAHALGKLIEDPERACDILGAIRSPETLDALDAARETGEILRDTSGLPHPRWPGARVRTPLLMKAESGNTAYAEERPGPVAFLVEAATAVEALALAERTMREKGAQNFSVHSTGEHVLQMAEDISLRVGVALSINLTGSLSPSQVAPFSDFISGGANPAVSDTIINSAYASRRFMVAESRRPAG